MPKRRSLVGTAHEAMGGVPKAPPEAKAPAKPRRATSRAAKDITPEAIAPAKPAAAAPERDPAATPSPASAYEAMMGFASATLRQNLETGARLARCKTPMEILAAQTAHATALTQSFISAFLRMVQLSMSGARWAPVKRSGDPY